VIYKVRARVFLPGLSRRCTRNRRATDGRPIHALANLLSGGSGKSGGSGE